MGGETEDRVNLRMALLAWAASVTTAVVVESTLQQRESAALAAAIFLHVAFFLFVIVRRRAALALLFLAMPLEPMLRTWAGTRFLTFVYGALVLILFDMRGALRRLYPLDTGFWLLFVVVAWMFLSLNWTSTPWAGLVHNFGMVGILVAYCMPRGLLSDHKDLDFVLRALVIGAVGALFIHLAVMPEAREGRLGAHRSMAPPDVGANFAVAIVAAIYLARSSGRHRVSLMASIALLSLGIALSAVRTTAAGMLVGAVSFLLLSSGGVGRWLRVGALVAALGAAYAFSYAYNRLPFESRAARTVSPESVDTLLTGRLSLWTVALAVIREHPWIGTGAGSFGEEFDRYYRLTPATHGYGRNPDAHSMPLRTAADAGIPAALLYVAFLFYCFATAWRIRHEPTGIGALAVGVTLSPIIMTCFVAFFQPVVWMGTGLGIWVLRLQLQQSGSLAPAPTGR